MYIMSIISATEKFENLACARDLAVVAFVILVEGAGGGIITGIDCVAGY